MGQSNIVVYRGDDFAMRLVFTDENEAVIDITGWTIFFTVKRREVDPDTKAVISVTISPTDPTNGIALVTVSNTITDVLSGLYYYDFQFKKADGTVQTLVDGGITFEKDITRRIT
jgi:hypothetical protein